MAPLNNIEKSSKKFLFGEVLKMWWVIIITHSFIKKTFLAVSKNVHSSPWTFSFVIIIREAKSSFNQFANHEIFIFRIQYLKLVPLGLCYEMMITYRWRHNDVILTAGCPPFMPAWQVSSICDAETYDLGIQ